MPSIIQSARGRAPLTTIASAVASILLLGVSVTPANAGVTVTGAGSTFAQIAIDEWRAGAARKLGLEVNYSGQGSSAGRRAFIEGTVDFASSDIPFEQDEAVSRSYTYLPLVAGGTALMYNLKDTTGKQVRDLRLSGETVASIFFQKFTKWNAPEIAADNPHLAGKLPATDINPTVRSGGSGTSAVFTGYLAAVAPRLWDEFAAKPAYADYIRPGARFTSNFPPVPGFQSQNGSDGVANFVANPNSGAGSIGYAEAGYAVQRGLPIASIKNQSGRYVQPGARNVAIGLTQATRNPDGTQNLERVYFNDDPASYPISSYNYMIAPTRGFDAGKGDVLGRYIIYAITEGQAKADPLGYSPLPPNLVQQGLDAVKEIPGAPTPPPLGDWGRHYEQLNVDEPQAVATSGGTVAAGSTAGGTAAGGGPAAGAGAAAGGGTAASGSGTGGPAAAAGAGGGGAAAGSAVSGGAAGGTKAGTSAGSAAGARTTVGNLGTAGVAVDPATGEVIEATTLAGGKQAFANLVTERRKLSRKDIDVRASDATPLFLAGLAIVLIVLAPPLLAAPAGALLSRRR